MKQSSQNLASSSIVTEFAQSLLEELLSSDSQLQEPIKFSPPRTLIPGSISIKRLADLFCQSVVTRKKTIIAKRTEISSWGRFSERFEDKVEELWLENKKLTDQTARKQIYNEMKPYLTGNSDGYLRVMTCKARKVNKLFGYEYDSVTLKKIKEQVNSKTITDQSSVDEIFETVATTSIHDSDDNFSNTSDDTVYFKEGTNESIEEVSKKSEVNASTKPTPAKILVRK
ncbi:unnamed protein product [Rhizophagus irregularis]|uniref:Uncharacterized protein n=1 Tax=Rhizophagus irregularis TaxID=588596 RepID=A0A915ZDW7_9GLOM|nr:unnamed protein product [Rhizophagus irregularis]